MRGAAAAKNVKHGKGKGLIPYARGGGGGGGTIDAAAAGLSQQKRGVAGFPPKLSQDV